MARYGSRGLTLPELLVVVAILGLLALGLPGLRQLVLDHRAWTWQHRLHVSLNLARSHALHTGQPTVVCATDGGGACAESGANWDGGWMVFEDPGVLNTCDPDPQGTQCLDGGGRILRIQDPTDALRIVANRNVSRRVRFNATGMSYGYTGRFTFCDRGGKGYQRGLVVSNSGRIRRAGRQELLHCD